MLVPTAITSITQNLPVPFLTGSIGGIAITAVQILGTFTSYGNEANPTTRTQYSKFVVVASKEDGGGEKLKTKPKTMVPSETGMTLIYAPALLVSVVIAVFGSSLSVVPPPTLAGVLCLIHFAKRCAEVKFLHNYSGTIELATAAFIGTYYALIAVLIASIATTTPTTRSITIGTTVFAIGLLGNFYHHSLLAKLRNKNDGPTSSGSTTNTTKQYVAPQGGLFRYVAAPHYLFELLGWLGMAIVSQHGNAYLVLTSMGSYLTGRAVAQNAWNRAKFTDQNWPSTRKNIVPFVF